MRSDSTRATKTRMMSKAAADGFHFTEPPLLPELPAVVKVFPLLDQISQARVCPGTSQAGKPRHAGEAGGGR